MCNSEIIRYNYEKQNTNHFGIQTMSTILCYKTVSFCAQFLCCLSSRVFLYFFTQKVKKKGLCVDLGPGKLLGLKLEGNDLLYTLRELLQKEQVEDYLIIESDNLILVETINGCSEPPWDCRALFAECVALKTLFSNLSVLHCRREANALADWAAKDHGRGNLPHDWASSPPQLMLDLICIDALFKGCTFAHI